MIYTQMDNSIQGENHPLLKSHNANTENICYVQGYELFPRNKKTQIFHGNDEKCNFEEKKNGNLTRKLDF